MDYQQLAANANIFSNAFLGLPEYNGFTAQPSITSHQAGQEMKSELAEATKMNQEELKSQIKDIEMFEKMWGNGSSDNLVYQLNPGYPNMEQQLQQYQMQLQQQKGNPVMNAQKTLSPVTNMSISNSSLIVPSSVPQQLPQNTNSLAGMGNNFNGAAMVQKQFHQQPQLQSQQSVTPNPQKPAQLAQSQQTMYPMMNGNMASNPYQLNPQQNYFSMPSQMQGFPCIPPYFPIQMLPSGQQQFMPLSPMQLLPYGFPPSQQYPMFTQLSPQRQALLQQQNIGIPTLQVPKLEPVAQPQQQIQSNPVPTVVQTPAQFTTPTTPAQYTTPAAPAQYTTPVAPAQYTTPAVPTKIDAGSHVSSTSANSNAQHATTNEASNTQPHSEVIDSTNPSLVEANIKPTKKKAKAAKDQAGSGMPKPALSYSCLISLALKNSKTGHLSVDQIYQFMCDHFPYFNTAPAGWKNSVRHNLSLNKSFQKIEKPSSNGTHHRKGCLWAMTDTKISQLGKEVRKWASKDPAAVTRAMKNPENLEELKLGNCVKEYHTKSQKHEKQGESSSQTSVIQESPSFRSEISEDISDTSVIGLASEFTLDGNEPSTKDEYKDDGSNESSAAIASSVVLSTVTNSSAQYKPVISCTKTPVIASANPPASSVNAVQPIPTPKEVPASSIYRTILPANYMNINPSMIQTIKIGNAKVEVQDFASMQTFGQQNYFTLPPSTN